MCNVACGDDDCEDEVNEREDVGCGHFGISSIFVAKFWTMSECMDVVDFRVVVGIPLSINNLHLESIWISAVKLCFIVMICSVLENSTLCLCCVDLEQCSRATA